MNLGVLAIPAARRDELPPCDEVRRAADDMLQMEHECEYVQKGKKLKRPEVIGF